MIKKCKNLKSLILKLHPNNFPQNINLLLQLIENLKQLKIINITSNINNPKYDICLEKKLNNFPKIKERKYYYEEFIIGNEVYVFRPKKTNTIINDNIKCIYYIDYIYNDYKNEKIRLLNNIEEIRNNCVLYLNNKRINSFEYKFKNKGNYILKIRFYRPITITSHMFSGCSSLTSLDLSNFNTNNVNNMSYMFSNCY